MSGYGEQIQAVVPDCDPRHVEAFMRLEYGTLDHLDRAKFAREARTAALCTREDPETAEMLARSYGL